MQVSNFDFDVNLKESIEKLCSQKKYIRGEDPGTMKKLM